MAERANIAALPHMRGESRLHTCEQCGEPHRPSGHLAGFPLLRCPSVAPRDIMLLKTRQIVIGVRDAVFGRGDDSESDVPPVLQDVTHTANTAPANRPSAVNAQQPRASPMSWRRIMVRPRRPAPARGRPPSGSRRAGASNRAD